jgi:hypothetical protein
MKMKRNGESSVRPARDGQRGQSLALVAALLVGLLAMAAFTVDLGEVYFSYQELVSATNAAALAGGAAIPNPTASGPTLAANVAIQYSAFSTNLNNHSNLQNVSLSYSFACVPPSAYPNLALPPCALYPSCPGGCNLIEVQETAKVPAFFAKIFGIKSFPLSATAVGSAKGGQVPPYHIMVVLDTTPSMAQGIDGGCTQNGTSVSPEQCAQYGIQTLLSELDPCSLALGCGALGSQGPGTVQYPDDLIGLMVFPGLCSLTTGGVTTTTCNNSTNLLPVGSTLTDTVANPTYAPDDYACPPTSPPIAQYNNDPEYMVLGFQENYRLSDTSGLNPSSQIFESIGAGTNNCGVPVAQSLNTFYAGAMQAAQDYLTLNNTQGVQNIIIFLSDGDANATTATGNNATMAGNVAQLHGPCATGTAPCGTNAVPAPGVYPPVDDCDQAVQAANYAKTFSTATQAPTLIYSISYGSETTGCATDKTTYSYKANGVTIVGNGVVTTPCATMQNMASTPLSQYFFSVPDTTVANGTVCANAVAITSLNQVFTTIAGDLTLSRLVPSGDF